MASHHFENDSTFSDAARLGQVGDRHTSTDNLYRVRVGRSFLHGGILATATAIALPLAVRNAISSGTNIVRAYREHLGYTIEDVAVTSGLTVEEIECIEAGHRFDKGYRNRIARLLGMPEGAFEAAAEIQNAA